MHYGEEKTKTQGEAKRFLFLASFPIFCILFDFSDQLFIVIL